MPPSYAVQQDWYHAMKARWTKPGQAVSDWKVGLLTLVSLLRLLACFKGTLVVDLGSHTYKSQLIFSGEVSEVHQDESCVLVRMGDSIGCSLMYNAVFCCCLE
jgi:hypothetical protein